METPAMLWEMGNSSIFASLAEPPGPNQPLELSMSYLKFSRGACLAPARGAAAAGEGAASDAAAMPAAAASDAPPSRSRRVQPELLRFSWLIIFLRRNRDATAIMLSNRGSQRWPPATGCAALESN